MSASPSHTCAVLATNELKCWGLNDRGQLGNGHVNAIGDGNGEMGDNLPVVELGFGMGVTAVVTGQLRTCALLDSGQVKCWGNSANGRLGEGGIYANNHRGDEAGEPRRTGLERAREFAEGRGREARTHDI